MSVASQLCHNICFFKLNIAHEAGLAAAQHTHLWPTSFGPKVSFLHLHGTSTSYASMSPQLLLFVKTDKIHANLII